MRLRHIELFEAIRRTGSLTEAAATLHISQPAASKMLAHAEAQLGYKLFERVRGRLVATPEAQALAPAIARLSQELADVRRLAGNLRDRPNGHLRLGASPALGLGLLPHAIRACRDAQPGITFDIHTHHSTEMVQGLMRRDLDLIVTFDTGIHPAITRIPLGTSQLVHLGRGEEESPISLAEAARDPLIALAPGDPAGALLQMALDAQGLAPDPTIQVQTHYVACALAEAGCGNTIVDAITARAMQRPGMAMRPIEPALRVPVSVMVRKQDPLSSMHRAFIDHLTAALSRGSATGDGLNP